MDGEDAEEVQHLQEKIAQIPELARQKELLHIHSTIAQCLSSKINERQLDVFFKLEEDIILNKAHQKDIIQALENEKGSWADKLRLFLIYYINSVSKSELLEMESILAKQNCPLFALNHIKNTKAFAHWAVSTDNAQPPKKEFWNIFSTLVSRGVQYLIPTKKDYYVTTIVENVMKNDKDLDYLYFDPIYLSKFPGSNTNEFRKKTPFKEGIVFMVGGGNYLEYQNIKDSLIKPNQQEILGLPFEKKIIYGSTEILNGAAFLSQLEQLGKGI